MYFGPILPFNCSSISRALTSRTVSERIHSNGLTLPLLRTDLPLAASLTHDYGLRKFNIVYGCLSILRSVWSRRPLLRTDLHPAGLSILISLLAVVRGRLRVLLQHLTGSFTALSCQSLLLAALHVPKMGISYSHSFDQLASTVQHIFGALSIRSMIEKKNEGVRTWKRHQHRPEGSEDWGFLIASNQGVFQQ